MTKDGYMRMTFDRLDKVKARSERDKKEARNLTHAQGHFLPDVDVGRRLVRLRCGPLCYTYGIRCTRIGERDLYTAEYRGDLSKAHPHLEQGNDDLRDAALQSYLQKAGLTQAGYFRWPYGHQLDAFGRPKVDLSPFEKRGVEALIRIDTRRNNRLTGVATATRNEVAWEMALLAGQVKA